MWQKFKTYPRNSRDLSHLLNYFVRFGLRHLITYFKGLILWDYTQILMFCCHLSSWKVVSWKKCLVLVHECDSSLVITQWSALASSADHILAGLKIYIHIYKIALFYPFFFGWWGWGVFDEGIRFNCKLVINPQAHGWRQVWTSFPRPSGSPYCIKSGAGS